MMPMGRKPVAVISVPVSMGKAIEVFCTFQEIDAVTETLDPHGVYLNVSGVPSRDAAEAMLKRLESWGCGHIHPLVRAEGNAHG